MVRLGGPGSAMATAPSEMSVKYLCHLRFARAPAHT